MATVAEVARQLRVSTDTVYRLIQTGRLNARRVPGVYGMVIEEKDIDNLQRGTAPTGEEMWRVGQVARHFGIAPETVHKFIREGRLKACKLGPRNSPLRIPASSVAQLEAEGMAEGAAA